MLRPDFPTEGVPKEQVMAQKLGSVEAYRKCLEGMKQTFEQEGITFNAEGQRTGSSIFSHRAMTYAAEHGKGDAMMEELFRRYTTERQWIGDVEVCVAAATAIGLEEQSARRYLESTEAPAAPWIQP